MKSKLAQQAKMELGVEIAILAGGLSSRMGTNKSALRFGSRTLLQIIRGNARKTGLPVRIVRRDIVPRCGPLGGIYTAMKRSRADFLIFISCDMPFIGPEHINRLHKSALRKNRSVFYAIENRVVFPFIIPRSAFPHVTHQLEDQDHSLQSFARTINAHRISPTAGEQSAFLNINTPRVYKFAQRIMPQ